MPCRLANICRSFEEAWYLLLQGVSNSPRGVEGAMFLRNFGNYLSVATASHLRRLKSSAAPLWEPQIKCGFFVYLYSVRVPIVDWLCQQYVVFAVNKSRDQWRKISENISTWSGKSKYLKEYKATPRPVARPWTQWVQQVPLPVHIHTYTGCNRRNEPDFGRAFLGSYYTDITQNTYIQSSMFTEILAREVWNIDSYYSLIDYQIHIETGRNRWFL